MEINLNNLYNFYKDGAIMKFCKILETALQNNDMKQIELAKLIGCSPKNISSYVCGKTEPDFETMMEICSVLHIDIAKLYAIDDNSNILFTRNNYEKDLLNAYRILDDETKKSLNCLVKKISETNNG